MKTFNFAQVKETMSIIDFFEVVMQAKPHGTSSNGVSRYGHCPSCGNHDNSHRVSVISKGFNCFGCSAKGDLIVAAELYWGVSKPRAAQMLMEYSSSTERAYRVPEPFVPAVRDSSAYKELVEKLTKSTKSENEYVINYLISRGISLSTIQEGMKRNLILALPSNPSHLSNWLKKYIGDELMFKTKILKEDRKSPGVIYKPLCFVGDNKESVEFRIARPVKNETEIKSIRYGSASPWTWKGENGVMVTEGVIDMLSAVELGTKRTVIALPGCQSYQIDWFKKYKGEQILLALDSDGPGIEASSKLQSELEAAGHSVHVYQLPKGCKDLNEQLLASKP